MCFMYAKVCLFFDFAKSMLQKLHICHYYYYYLNYSYICKRREQKKLMFNLKTTKNMKKFFLVAVATLISAVGFAQAEKGFRFGVNAGMTISTRTGVGEYGPDAGIGYEFGAIAEYNFNEKLYLGSGLNFINKANKYGEGEYSETVSGTYLTLPIHIGYRFSVAEDWYLHGQAGPSIGIGLWGDEDWFGDEGFNRFALGLGAKIGAEYKKFQLNFGINYDLTTMEKGFDGYNPRMFNCSIGLAYMF